MLGSVKYSLVGALMIIGLVGANVARSEVVTLSYKGIVLNANMELAMGKKVTDGAILITHGGLAHRDMELIVQLQEKLKARGYNTLAINLGLGIDNRRGMYDCAITHRHRNNDAAEEINTWVAWLKAQGARRVALLGHSRGGSQTALAASLYDNDVVKAVMLLSPATQENTSAADYQRRYKVPLEPVLAEASRRVGKGEGSSVMEHVNLLNCADAPVSAETFVSYYGPDALVDTPSLIPKIKKPILVVVAGNDEVVAGLDKKIEPLVAGKRVQMEIIEGSDHYFRDLYADDAIDAIEGFIKSVGYDG